MTTRGEDSHLVPWYQKGALYQIYPLSFADSNGDGYGDIQGIIDHLDYLGGASDSLGVAAIWLSPMYRSPMKDFGYDISDFRDIDPIFGSLEDFDRMLGEIHRRGMKLLMDFVPNHTSDQHPWFREALQSKASKKRDWYIWADPKPDGSEPNNWLSVFGGPAWTFDKTTGQYYLHTFLPSQPDLNWRNPEVKAEMEATLRFWLDRGVDGFRTDSVFTLIKDAKLQDDPINPNYREGVDDPRDRNLPVHSAGQHEMISLLDEFCDVVALDGGSFIVSEAYLGIEQMKKLYNACDRHPIHAPFNFDLMFLPWGAQSFAEWIDSYEETMGPHDVPNYVLGNHDKPRLASRVGLPQARMLAVLQVALRGLPVIYYGDELGQENTVVTQESERDPWGIRVPGHGLGRDCARAPMPWNDSVNDGFSTAKPWLPLAPGSHRRTVEVESRNPESTLNLYRQLLHLKSSIPALALGSYNRLKTDHEDVYAFERVYKKNRCIIVLNFAKKSVHVSVEGSDSGVLLVSTQSIYGDDKVGPIGRLRLAPYEARIYEMRSK